MSKDPKVSYTKLMISTVALPLVVALPCPAFAQYNMVGGENLTVNAGTTLSGNPAVVVNSVNAGSITNNGTILDNAATGFGVRIINGGNLTGGIFNNAQGLISGTTYGFLVDQSVTLSGDIVNAGDATISGGTSAIQINLYASITGNIENTGNITGGTNGITFGAATTMTGDINNYAGGVISGSRNGISVSNSIFSGSINNSGIIRGFDNGSPAASGAIFIQSARVTGGIYNDGIIDGQGNTAINLISLNGLTPMTFNGGRVIGDIIDIAPTTGRSTINITGDFVTEGNISVSDLTVAAGQMFTISPSNTVTLNNMSTSAGTWVFDVNANTPATAKLTVTNGDVDLTGSTVTAGSILGPITNGSSVLLADGNAPITAGPGGTLTFVTDKSSLWDFQMVDGTYGALGGDNTQLYLIASYGSGGDISSNATNANNQSVGGLLDSIITTTDLQLSSIINSISNASSVEELNDVISSVSATPDNSSFSISRNISSQTLNIVSSRLGVNRARQAPVSTALAALSAEGNMKPRDFSNLAGVNFWSQVYGTNNDQGARGGVAGYDAKTRGMAFGIDTDILHDKATLGVSVGYARTDVKSNDVNNTDTDIDSLLVSVYGDYDLDDNIFVKGVVGYVKGDNTSRRYDVGGVSGLTARGNYKSDFIFVDAELGKSYKKQNMILTPALTGFYGYYKADSYTESGAGGANLNVESDAVGTLDVGAKLDVKWSYKLAEDKLFSPGLSFGYRYNVLDDRQSNTSSFTGGGATFQTKGATSPRSTLNVGLGTTYSKGKSWDIYTGYNFEYKEDYTAHSTLLKIKYKF